MFPTYIPIPSSAEICRRTQSVGSESDLSSPTEFGHFPVRYHLPSDRDIARFLHVVDEVLAQQVVAAVEVAHWDSLLKPTDEDEGNQCAHHGEVYGGKCVNIPTGATSWDQQALTRDVRTLIVEPFIQSLPDIAELLEADLEIVIKKDVVVNHRSEVILNYPGLFCLTFQRLAHRLHVLGAPINLTRMITEIAHSKTGIDIHPATTIGHSCFIDHGTGIVIGATAEIGDRVSIYQGVCLGAKSFKENDKGERIKHLPRHPIVEDDVTLYAHCSVLGRTRVGKGATIGGNVWVIRDVPPGEILVQGKAEKGSTGYSADFFKEFFAEGYGI
jgi:serine O-acetyltransferase